MNAAWYQDAVFYKLHVKSFFDSDHDGVGDFPGLTSKLDYLQELGVTCLWLLPFFPSPWRDDGYDVADYHGIHPAYGTMQEFQAFVQETHRRGLRIAAEMVINHTSDQHPWFQAARASAPGSPLRDFYVWSHTQERYRNCAVSSLKDQRSNWTWDSQAKAYYWHRFFDHQPDLNYDNPLVRDEMKKVLRFWLDLGVDGLCLNGAAFLAEREETPCEHLPETHAFLKEVRRELEPAYPGCMLQAGVNAWPADSATYFGAGDECHMCPHLALAQRLFLALRQEDRHAIADILRQTPQPPAGCEWVLLLRNHDELTLTLATDEERDYMYREYAADPRLRLHGGISRRLAPMMDNNRARLELLFGLIFSLPGAPLLYYGDEIGMGDNSYLGGRAGVRTPMQWNADRNAGFSAGDTQQLYAPPVADPVYGFQAVNVEAQRRNPSSLFHWLRRLIALRKRSRTLNEGSLELLEPANPKVFAFVRRREEESILIVANLSRVVQPVELNLAEFAGRTPVEISGRVAFPPLGNAPMFLSLGPHAIYWFALQNEADDVSARLAPIPLEKMKDVPSIQLAGSWHEVLDGAGRKALEDNVLPKFLQAQRWFGGKARQVESVRVADWGELPSTTCQAFWTLLTVQFGDGSSDRYFLPLAISIGKAAVRIEEALRPWMLARLSGPDGEAVLHDALADDDVCQSLLAAIANNGEFATQAGQIRGHSTSAFAALRGAPDYPLPVVRGNATSSNSLVFYGRRLLFKLFRRLQSGLNPDFEIGRYLTEEHEFDRIPKVAGVIEYRRPDEEPVTLGIFQALVPNQGDGWQHAIDELARYYERASQRMYGPDPIADEPRSLVELSSATPPPFALEAIGSYLHAAATLGRRTGEMHRALAAETNDPAFAPESLAPNDLDALHHETLAQARAALTALRENLPRLDESIAGSAERLLEIGPHALESLANSGLGATESQKIRCHGDYHLGQVLWVENDFILLDFEGEPSRSLAERREKQSPLKDVAGMLRSYHYAAYAGLFAFTQNRPQDYAALEPWAEVWQQWASAAFLDAYRATTQGAAFVPAEPAALAGLLDIFMLDKAFYELAYELNNRPTWVRIPLRGILALLEKNIDAAVEAKQD